MASPKSYRRNDRKPWSLPTHKVETGVDHYLIWCNLIDSSQDLRFCENVQRYLGYLQEQGLITGFRILRRKLGFGPPELGEFQITIEVRDLAQLEQTFQCVASRGPEIEALHRGVFSAVKDARFALYRDFPDAVRSGLDETVLSG